MTPATTRRRAAFFLAGSLMAAAFLSGCRPGGAGDDASVPAATAVQAVAEPMRPFFAAGLGLLVLGGLTTALGGGTTGPLLMGLGIAVTATGVLFIQYPWTVLILALAASLLAALALWDRLRTGRELARNREALAATAAVIQNRPEGQAIKEGLRDMDRETNLRIRSVIEPLKEELRREGRIT